MKRMLLLLIALGGSMLHVSHAIAQSAEDTVDWLRVKLSTYQFVDDSPSHRIETTSISVFKSYYTNHRNENCAWDCRITDYTEGDWRNVTGVSWTRGTNASGKPLVTVVLAGTFNDIKVNPRQVASASRLSLSLKDIEDSEVERIVKAIKHLAQLQGARLVQDELF